MLFKDSEYYIFSSYPGSVSSNAKKFAYPPIYKDNRIWQGGVEIINNTKSELITIYGVIDGKMQTSIREVNTNKSNRDILVQSLVELNHKYHSKMKKDGFEFKEKNMSTIRKNTRPFPMAAHTYGAEKHLKFPVCVQPKLDGVRMLVDKDENGHVRLSSRERSDYSHLLKVFEDDVKCLFTHLPPNSILDGEIIIPSSQGEDFQLAVSAAKKAKGGLSENALNNMVYAIFAFYVSDKLNLTFCDRNEILDYAFGECDKLSKVKKVETYSANNDTEVKRAFKLFLNHGHEGLMIYNPDGTYEPGKRSNNILKLKEFDDTEGVIVGVKPGKGREKDAALVDIDVGGGKIVTMHPTGSIDERKEWLKHPERIIGKKMTYTFQGLTKDGVPRFPVARVIRDYE